jgi:hypothetical protein
MDASDQGHRYGNFPNYYAFHPPDDRIRVLERCKFTRYIRNGLSSSSSSSSFCRSSNVVDAADDDVVDDDKAFKSARKTTRRHERDGRHDVVYLCDLGCNEGDMTIALAKSLVLGGGCAIDDADCVDNGDDPGDGDGGGTTSVIDDHSKFANNKKCTAKIDNSIHNDESDGKIGVQCLGLDLDRTLIERAIAKFSTADAPPLAPRDGAESVTEGHRHEDDSGTRAIFQVCDLSSESEHNRACVSFFGCGSGSISGGMSRDDKHEKDNGNSRVTLQSPRPLFHLTTIFSTTMWIHVHAGDHGLRKFLERACSWTKMYLLIEPQPSGW